jgi:hypothetical protein
MQVLGDFLWSPLMAQSLQEHNASSISNVYPLSNNSDLWQYYIRTLRLLEYSQRIDFVGE